MNPQLRSKLRHLRATILKREAVAQLAGGGESHGRDIEARRVYNRLLRGGMMEESPRAEDASPPRRRRRVSREEAYKAIVKIIDEGSELTSTMNRLLASLGDDVDYVPNPDDNTEETLCFIAVNMGREDVVKMLLNRGADPNWEDWEGATACNIAAENGHTDMVRLLLTHGANPNAARTRGGDEGKTPLYAVAVRGDSFTVKVLLEGGADPNKADYAKLTPLHAAARYGHHDVIQELFKWGSPSIIPDPKSRDGKTPCDIALDDYVVLLLKQNNALTCPTNQ
tara:strand:+ start:268 stop:1113 length:846 start_codon:yes stop_codon:yes gene_type:complete